MRHQVPDTVGAMCEAAFRVKDEQIKSLTTEVGKALARAHQAELLCSLRHSDESRRVRLWQCSVGIAAALAFSAGYILRGFVL